MEIKVSKVMLASRALTARMDLVDSLVVVDPLGSPDHQDSLEHVD